MLSKEMLERFYVELTNPDELGLTDSRLRIVFDMALRSLDAGWVSVEDRLPDLTDEQIEKMCQPGAVTLINQAAELYSVTERLPEEGQPILLLQEMGHAWARPEGIKPGNKAGITHWSPLPAAPSAQRDDSMADAAISRKR